MTSSYPRRTVVAGSFWAVPAIAVAAAAPAVAASSTQPSTCGVTRPTALRRYAGLSLNLTLSEPDNIVVNKAGHAPLTAPRTTPIAVPTTLTIANTGSVPVPAGTKVVFTAWKLSPAGIVDKGPATLVVTAGKTPNSRNEQVDSLVSPELSSSQSSLATGCVLAPGQEITVSLTWQRVAGSNNDIADLQFLARVVTDGSQLSYTEFQSDEVIGGMNH